jgi:predicted metal-dependent peptidase
MNPSLFLNCSYNEMKALIKHEVYHVISKHHIRARAVRNKYSPLAINLAMDISVNQYIINLPLWSETIEKVRRSYNVQLKEERSMEEYAEEIQKALDKLKKSKDDDKGKPQKMDFMSEYPDLSSAHDFWEKIMETTETDQIEEVLKKMISNVQKGKIPKSVEEIMAKLYSKPEITWSDYLKRMVGTAAYGHKKTVTRKDRRQPERLDLRGRLVDHRAEIAVAIDISGSVSDNEIEQIMAEIFSIVKNSDHKITVIECDDTVQRVYTVNNVKEIKTWNTIFSSFSIYERQEYEECCTCLFY